MKHFPVCPPSKFLGQVSFLFLPLTIGVHPVGLYSQKEKKQSRDRLLGQPAKRTKVKEKMKGDEIKTKTTHRHDENACERAV